MSRMSDSKGRRPRRRDPARTAIPGGAPFAARAYIEKGLFDAAAAEAAAAQLLTPTNTQAVTLEVCANASQANY